MCSVWKEVWLLSHWGTGKIGWWWGEGVSLQGCSVKVKVKEGTWGINGDGKK